MLKDMQRQEEKILQEQERVPVNRDEPGWNTDQMDSVDLAGSSGSGADSSHLGYDCPVMASAAGSAMQYNGLVPSHNKILVAGVLLALLAAVVGPVVLTGYTDLQAARSALAEGHASEAERLFESAARKLTWQQDLWEQAGLAAYRGGDKNGAVRLLEIARRKEALSAEGWITLGTVFWIKQDATNAIAIWKAGILAFPRSAQLYDQLITAYHSRDDFAAEQDALTKRLAIAEDAGQITTWDWY